MSLNITLSTGSLELVSRQRRRESDSWSFAEELLSVAGITAFVDHSCGFRVSSFESRIHSSPLTASPVRLCLRCKPICMENNPNNADAPVTKAGLKAEFGKLEKKMEQLLSEQANVILEAVGETMEKKLGDKFDPVITKLDGIMKGVEALQQENTVGAEQLRRHEDQLQKHEARIAKLETAPA